MVAVRTDRIRRRVRKNVTSADSPPSGPSSGFYCEEYTKALLRIKAANAATTYALKISTFENDGGNDWIEDPSERRAIAAGLDYTRMFRCGPVDRIACELTAVGGAGGKVDVFWTFS